jgi:3-oxoacyl-[acyl-carrier-protein] synthase-3
MSRRAIIAGTGSALPARRVTNDELAQTVDTSDEWIVERTGIHARHIAGEGETTGSLGADAARNALAAAGIEPGQVGLIILATATPDQTFPATATRVQNALGIIDCVSFDVAAVCSGFLYALSVADSMIRAGGIDVAHPRLGRSRHLRPVRRWRRRGRADGGRRRSRHIVDRAPCRRAL